MRQATLNVLKGGIDRQRIKGGASPEVLYDLLNGFVTQQGTVESRPGTGADATLPAGTKGLCAFNGAMVVFAISPKTMPAGYTCEIIIHPTAPTTPIKFIHYAGPFLGSLYVTAEFTNGDVFDYWLQTADTWRRNQSYAEGDLVQPTTPNGYIYRAHRNSAVPKKWAPNVTRVLAERVEPTTANGFEYVVIDVQGTNPRSGPKEPAWNRVESGLTIEEADNTPPGPPPAPPKQQLPPGYGDRYGGGGGAGGGHDGPPKQQV